MAETLDQQEVHIIRELFTADVCRHITWEILTEGRSFFNTVLVESQFRRAERFKWPTSLIHKITDDVRFAKAINRPMYPVEWCITTPATQGTGGVAAAEGGTKRETTKGVAKGTPTAAKMTKGDATQVGGEAAAAVNNNNNNHGWMTPTHAS